MDTKTLFPLEASSKLISSSKASNQKRSSAKSRSSSLAKTIFHAYSFTELVQYLNQKEQELSVKSKS